MPHDKWLPPARGLDRAWRSHGLTRGRPAGAPLCLARSSATCRRPVGRLHLGRPAHDRHPGGTGPRRAAADLVVSGRDQGGGPLLAAGLFRLLAAAQAVGVLARRFHAVNVLLHAANTLLLWHLMRRLKVPGAWLVAAVFAVHPVHVESVAWVIELKDVLSGLLYLSALLAWIRFAGEPRAGRYLTSLALYVARRPACSDAAAGSAAPARTARRAGRQGKPACGRDATVQGCCRTAIRPTGSALGTCGVPVSTALSMTLDRSRAPTPGTSPAGKRA